LLVHCCILVSEVGGFPAHNEKGNIMTITKANLTKSANAVIDYSRAKAQAETVAGKAAETLAQTVTKLVKARFPLEALGSAREAADAGATLEHEAIRAAIRKGFPDEEKGAQWLLAADPKALSDKEKSDCKPGTKTENRFGNGGKGSRRYWGQQEGSVRGAIYRAYAEALGVEKPKAEPKAEPEPVEAEPVASEKSVRSKKLGALVDLRNWASDKGLDEGELSIEGQKIVVESLERCLAAFGLDPESI
jgi:hypothetical protein